MNMIYTNTTFVKNQSNNHISNDKKSDCILNNNNIFSSPKSLEHVTNLSVIR